MQVRIDKGSYFSFNNFPYIRFRDNKTCHAQMTRIFLSPLSAFAYVLRNMNERVFIE